MMPLNTELYDEGLHTARVTYIALDSADRDARHWASIWLSTTDLGHLPFYQGYAEGLRQSIAESDAARADWAAQQAAERASQPHPDSVALDRIATVLLDEPGSTNFWAVLRDTLAAAGRLPTEVTC